VSCSSSRRQMTQRSSCTVSLLQHQQQPSSTRRAKQVRLTVCQCNSGIVCAAAAANLVQLKHGVRGAHCAVCWVSSPQVLVRVSH
jgi:hypothetical protein